MKTGHIFLRHISCLPTIGSRPVDFRRIKVRLECCVWLTAGEVVAEGLIKLVGENCDKLLCELALLKVLPLSTTAESGKPYLS